jgi:dTDP-glucose 4,6-dehydratase
VLFLYDERMRFLITGAAGFIGSNFVRHLYKNSKLTTSKVVVIDKLTYAGSLTNLTSFSNKNNFKFIKGDICDANLIRDLVSDCDIVVHFAAESHVDRSIDSSKEFIRTNILGTEILLNEVKNNPKVKFLHVSTDEVYGSIESGNWDESCALKPNSPYAASKASSDLLALAYCHTYSLDIMISRCCNNYGPNQFPEKLIPLFVTNLMNGKKLPVYGDGSNVREWIHVDDHCKALELIIHNGAPGEIYNIGTGIEISNLNLAKKLLKIFNFDESYLHFVDDRLGHDKRYSLNFAKARIYLGYEPSVSFDEGLKETIKWYSENYNQVKL